MLLSVFLIPNIAGTGVGVHLEWSQPRPPYNSDIRNYILTRMVVIRVPNEPVVYTDAISIIVNTPYNPSIASITYQDDAIVAGTEYAYQIRTQDYSAFTSTGSNMLSIAIPGGEPPPE